MRTWRYDNEYSFPSLNEILLPCRSVIHSSETMEEAFSHCPANMVLLTVHYSPPMFIFLIILPLLEFCLFNGREFCFFLSRLGHCLRLGFLEAEPERYLFAIINHPGKLDEGLYKGRPQIVSMQYGSNPSTAALPGKLLDFL